MARTILLVLGFLGAFLGALAVLPHGGAALTLRASVVASGDVVLAGDFFVDAADAAERPLFVAPAPGASGAVSARRLAEAAAAAGLDWVPYDPRLRIRVARPAAQPERPIAADELATLVRHAIADTLPEAGTVEDIAVTLSRTAAPIQVPSEGTYKLDVVRFDLDRRAGRFDAVVRLEAGPEPREHRLNGRYEVHRPVPVLAVPLARGEIVTPAHLTLERMPDPGAATLTRAGDIAGLAARRSLRAGQTLRASDLEAPKLVTRNQLVTVVFALPGMTLTTQGRAMADAAAGEAVAVLNVRSNRIVQTVAESSGRVRVGAARTAMR